MFLLSLILAVVALNGVAALTNIAQVSCDGGYLFGRKCFVSQAKSADAGLLEARLVQGSGCSDGRYYIDVEGNNVYVVALTGCSGTFQIVKLDPPAYTGGCGVDVGSGGFRIVGGERAPACQYPWMVFIIADGIGCTGSIIDKDNILTTANCVYKKGNLISADNISVHTGSIHWRTGVQRSVTKMFTRPDYNVTHFHNNIAILRLKESIKFDSCHSPVCLGSDTQFVSEETNCRVMGWGTRSEIHVQHSEWLQWASETIVPRDTCKRMVQHFNYPDGSVFCSKADSTAICKGDGGSPMVCLDGNKWHVYGISSALNSKGCANHNAILTSIPHYYNWIQQSMDSS